MKTNRKFDVKIKLLPDGSTLSGKPQWLHVEWFKVRGCKPRKYVDQIWLTENESEATPVEAWRAKDLASTARDTSAFDGIPIGKTVYLAKRGRKWEPVRLKTMVDAEAKDRDEQVRRAISRARG